MSSNPIKKREALAKQLLMIPFPLQDDKQLWRYQELLRKLRLFRRWRPTNSCWSRRHHTTNSKNDAADNAHSKPRQWYIFRVAMYNTRKWSSANDTYKPRLRVPHLNQNTPLLVKPKIDTVNHLLPWMVDYPHSKHLMNRGSAAERSS